MADPISWDVQHFKGHMSENGRAPRRLGAGEINGMLIALLDIEDALKGAAGSCALVEVLMRLIGQLSPKVQEALPACVASLRGRSTDSVYNAGRFGDAIRTMGQHLSPEDSKELQRLISKVPEEGRKKFVEDLLKRQRVTDDYLNCDLVALELAIVEVFGQDLEPDECERLKKFRRPRNGCIHGNLVSLMEAIGIEPTSRQITGHRDGKATRVLVDRVDVWEAILSADRNGALQAVNQDACELVLTLKNKIIRSMAQ